LRNLPSEGEQDYLARRQDNDEIGTFGKFRTERNGSICRLVRSAKFVRRIKADRSLLSLGFLDFFVVVIKFHGNHFVDINILCRLFQHQCHERAAFEGLNGYRAAESVVLLFQCSTVPADRGIDS
jgi:hypothetical protein